jgi:hypothetical protein
VSIVNGQKLVKNPDGTFNRLDQLNFSNGLLSQFFPYDPRFTGGVNVAAGVIDAAGNYRIATAPDAGGGPQVRVFRYDAASKSVVEAAPSFFAFEPDFHGGVRVAMGDVNGDGVADIIVAAGIGGGPRVRVIDGKTLFTTGAVSVIRDFFAYEPTFRGGVFVDAADYNGDGKADILVGPGKGGADRIRVFDGVTLGVAADFFAGIGSPKNDPLFGANNGFRNGVGGVAFTFGSAGTSRDILVSSPRTTTVIVKEFTGNGTTPTASKSFFANPQITPIVPDPTTLSYGASVAGLNQ